jgi:hypothetical protein
VKAKNAIDAESYAVEAVASLKRANIAGLFKDPRMLKQLQTDKDLNPLRERPDFKKIVDDAAGERK